jgi:spore maturation protein CgeB
MLDVMACNGFLLTPVQEELLEYFAPNQDVAVYSNLEEAVDLERFYLTHDSERMNCIKNARAKIDAAFRMEDRFKTILEYSGVKI